MRFVVSTLNENPGHPTGMMDYYRQLAHWLPKVDPESEYGFIASEGLARALRLDECNVDVVKIGSSNERKLARVLSEQMLIPHYLRRHPADALFCTCVAPVFAPRRVPVVYGVFATQHVRRGFVAPVRRVYRRLLTAPSLRRADTVLVNSAFCGDELRSAHRIPPGKLRTVCHGIDRSLFNDSPLTCDEARRLHKFDLPDRYVLFVSQPHIYKDTGTLLRAFGSVCREMPDVGLVVVGGYATADGGLAPEGRELVSIAARSGFADRLRFTGYVPNGELRPLYCKAAAFVQTSLYETFGKTVVEAMACGCPLIWADAAATPEIAGDAGLPYPPGDDRRLAAGLKEVLSSDDKADVLRKRGLLRAQAFSFENEARELADVLHDTAKRKC